MIEIKRLSMNMLEENCYIISDDTKEAVIIDCGAISENDQKKIIDYTENNNLKIVHHICTHMHYDHCFGVNFIYDKYNCLPEYHIEDYEIYHGKYDEIFGELRIFMQRQTLPEAKIYLTENDVIKFGNHELNVITTPGHTPGGVCFYCKNEKVIFSGDTLFYCSIGRSDFPGGNADILINSIKKKIFTLPEDIKIYPGHGPETTIEFEKKHNPYVF